MQLYYLICGYSTAENPLFHDTVGAPFTTFQLTPSVTTVFMWSIAFTCDGFFASRAKWLAKVQDLTGLGKIIMMFMYKQVHNPISLNTVKMKSR